MAPKSSLALILMLFSTAAIAQSVGEKTGVNSVLASLQKPLISSPKRLKAT